MNTLTTFIENCYIDAIKSPLNGIDILKPIDIATSELNIHDIYTTLVSHNLNPLIVFGTMLGMHRDNSLIPHDTDSDMAIQLSNQDNIINAIKDLVKLGFVLCRYSTDMLISLSRNDEYTDIYLFTKQNETNVCNIYELDDLDFTNPSILKYKKNEYNTVNDIEKFLVKYYGSNWIIPIKGISAHPRHSGGL